MDGAADWLAVSRKNGTEEVSRRASRVDANHDAVVSALRAAGACVQSLASIGRGCPDLLIYFGDYYIFEVKDGNKPPSKRRLTKDQIEWRRAWKGPVVTVTSPDEALRILGALA